MIIYRKTRLEHSEPRSTPSDWFPSVKAIKSNIDFNKCVTGKHCLPSQETQYRRILLGQLLYNFINEAYFLQRKFPTTYVTAGVHRKLDESCALLGYYIVSSGNFLLTFRDNLSLPSSGFMNLKT